MCSRQFMTITNMSYEHPDVRLFDKPFPGQDLTVREMLLRNGPDTDIDRFIHSGLGQALLKSYDLQFRYSDGMDPGVVEYWDSIGVLKEEHDKGLRTRWFSYLPHSALDEASDKLYPLIINLPHDPFITEGRGYPMLASTQEAIVVIPTAADIEDIYTLYTNIVAKYKIDKSRVYMSGFSFAGFRTLAFALRHPEPLAGIAVNCHLWPYMWQLPSTWIRDHMAGMKMPIINYEGNTDFAQGIPFNGGFFETDTPNGSDHVHTAQDSVDRANLWLGINGCPLVTMDEAMAMKNSGYKWERELGLPVWRGETRLVDDTEYHFCDFLSDDDICRTRIVVMDNIPHFEFGSMAQVAWDFLKGFSRAGDGRSVFSDGS